MSTIPSFSQPDASSSQALRAEQFDLLVERATDFAMFLLDAEGKVATWNDGALTLVENPDYHRSNGISALKAKDEIHENFLLLMADHIFEPETAKALMREPLEPGEVILAVDPKIDRIYDLDDATKVRRDGDRIVDIGKEIANYDALDTGMFLCGPVLFDKLESATRDGNCSLSDGMRQLARERSLRAFEIGEAHWQDVDTPEALTHAESIFDRHFGHQPVGESLVGDGTIGDRMTSV